MTIISLEAAKAQTGLKERKRLEIDSIHILLGEFREILDDLVERRLTDQRSLMAANWMLYQIAMHSRAEDMIFEAKTNGQVDEVLDWLNQCEERIQDGRCSETVPTIPAIIFDCSHTL